MHRSYATVGAASTLALVVALSPAQMTRSQTNAIAAPASVAIQFEPPAALPPPPIVRDPGSGRSQGGAGRGCNTDRAEEQPIPLVPLAAGSKNVRWGLTTADRPTFWLHTPEGIKDGALVVLALQDRTDKTSRRLTFQIPPNTPPAVLSLPIPASASPLQANTPYRWEIRLFCNSGNSNTQADSSIDAPIIFSGGIQRITPSAKLQRQLATVKTPLDRATAYASNGIWYDALTTLGLQVQGKQSIDSAIVRAWSDLLRQVDLEAAAAAPIAPCCASEK
ncbi:DUF928 domain-containing protein [Leptolyngbya sp. FACHB-321]|uniref:DUF928 domain-containing protein n=1 Tax=Leptolyngbya sp. FACHB-321 TaxID=2692807 RepID=UPI001F551345|nr:DUF928 domain-containing protein [Leptolyngbya sp. FACHB-321]